MREPEWRDTSNQGRARSTVKVLITFNVVVFIIQNFIDTYGGEQAKNLLPFMMLSADGLSDGCIWQLLSYQFMHAGVFHILCNMIGLYFIGKAIEEFYGHSVILQIYIIGGVLGGILQCGLVFTGHISDALVLGASASVLALLGAFTSVNPERRLTLLLFFVLPVNVKASTIFWVVLGWAVFGVVFPYGNVAHGAHLGGVLAGWVYARWVLIGGFSLADWGPLARSRARKSKRRKVVNVGTARAFSTKEDAVVEAEEISRDEYIQQEIDPILEKITKKGIHSLSERERKILDEARKRMN